MQQLAGSTAKFWVEENCADPVMVYLSVDGRAMNGYRGRFSVGGDGLHADEPNSISADYGRNASHLWFQVCRFVFTCRKDAISCTCMYSTRVLYSVNTV